MLIILLAFAVRSAERRTAIAWQLSPRRLMPINNLQEIVGLFQCFDQWWAQQSPATRRTFQALPRLAQVSLIRQVVQPDVDQVVHRRLVIQRGDSRQQFAQPG